MRVSEYKRALLYRKAQANICKNDYFNKIQSFTNNIVIESDFLTLEETDNIIKHLNDKKINSKIKVEIDNYQQVVAFIKEKGAGFSSYLLIDGEWKLCGMYKLSSQLSSDYNFDELHSDEIRLISSDLSFQIQIDYDHNQIECEYIMYE
ncbi:hypothetical protein [Enterobacter sp. 186315]